MFSLQTPRLKLIPLQYDDLLAFIRDRQELEHRWGLQLTNEVLDPRIAQEMVETRKFWLKFVKDHPDNYPWYSPWQIVHKEMNRIIGSLGFDGPPSLKGEVMIGYTIDQPFHNQGYATEAVQSLIAWAFQEIPDFKIIAETHKDHRASERVLEKVGFSKKRETDFSSVWEILNP